LLYNNKSLTKITTENNKSIEKSIIDFQVILCPITLLRLNSSKCSNCQYCKMTASKHNTGRTLTTLVCLYGSEKECDEK